MAKNDITGDALRSRELSPQGKANWDAIFPPRKKCTYTPCGSDGRACAHPNENKPGCVHSPQESR